MNLEIYQISAGQFNDMLGGYPGRNNAIIIAKLSSEIIVGMFGDTPLCYIGLAPQTMISDSAYVWMIETEAGVNYSRTIARYSRGFIETALLKYTRLYGHCFNEKSAAWLRWLGAEFISPTEFEIRRR